MARTPLALIKPELLRWARERRRLSIDQAAKKSNVAVEKLVAWETGTERPTIAQLRTLANTYKRPLAVFYLPEPPRDFDAMSLADYRRAPGAELPLSPELALEVRLAEATRVEAEELSAALDLQPRLLSTHGTLAEPPEVLAKSVRSELGIDTRTQASWRQPRLGYNAWRRAIESLSILTFQFTRVESAEARGFSISGPIFSIVAVNGSESYTGRTFSLMHELGHVVLNQGGMCDYREDAAEERFCNEFAANLLVPRDDLTNAVASHPPGPKWSDESLQELARSFAVSEEVILRRLLTLGLTTREFYQQKRALYLARAEAAAKEKEDAETTGGPSVPQRVVARFGISFVQLVLTAKDQGAVTIGESSDMLSAKLKHFPEIEQIVAARA